VVSVAEKAHLMRQVGTEKVNESEPSMRCRNSIDDIRTRVPLLPWDEPGGNLSTALAVSGIETARTQFRHQCGTWERLALTSNAAMWDSNGRTTSSGNCKWESTCAGQAGGPSRSSGETPVMGVERRGRIVQGCWPVNRVFREEPGG
jgi:hypothetical protein